MKFRILLGIALATGALAAADGPAPVSAKTTEMEITARLINDKQGVQAAVGDELKRQYTVVEVTVVPRGGYPVKITRDDFLLRSERDNERATADSPERVAGAGVLVLGGSSAGRPVYSQSGEPVFVGGMPGVPGSGPPRRMGTQDNQFGSGTANAPGESTTKAAQVKESPLEATLQQKELHFGEIRKPVTGYLYFPVDPNQKVKNFHLHYKGAGGVCELRFR